MNRCNQRSTKKDYDYKKLGSTGREGAERAGGSRQGIHSEEVRNQDLEDDQHNLTLNQTNKDTQVQPNIEDIQIGEPQSHFQYGEGQPQLQAKGTTKIMGDAEIAKLSAEELTITEDIDDYMGENAIEEIGSNIHDHDDICKRIEDLRTLYRGKHNQLKSTMVNQEYIDKYGDVYSTKMAAIKDYIKSLKTQRKSLRNGEELKLKKESDVKEAKFKFLEQETSDAIKRLDAIFSLNEDEWTAKGDDDILKRKNEVSKQVEELHSFPKRIQDIMDSSASVNDSSKALETLQTHYAKLLSIKDVYTIRLQKEVKSRELDDRQKSYDTTKIKINLPKFGGYKSSMDFYTFKSNFERIHKKTPKSALRDLLIHNFLENPALILVKDVKDIDDIWERLKDAYGDCKVMLQRKLSEINTIDGLWNFKDPEKMIEGFSKVINLMRDLMSLSKQHSIENKLYLGDALDRIVGLLGESRIHRWLTLSCEKETEGEEKWKEFMAFLDKEIKVCQQRVLLPSKKSKSASSSDVQKEKDKDSFKKKHNSHFTQDQNRNLNCSYCGANDHVATRGPKGSKLVQYFSCVKFANDTCIQRFETTKGKGLCYQCLFPGGRVDKGKHKEGNCQKDFICKHPSHEPLTVKKHVLLCDEHKQEEENQNTLKEYVRRCIEKRTELPDFCKNITIHHNNYYPCDNLPPAEDDEEEDDGDSIYMLQTIKVDGETYNIFYDSGCRRFAIRHDAVCRLGNRACELIPGPTPLGGVAGMKSTSPHGIFRVKLPLENGKNATFKGLCLDVITETFPNYPLQKIEQDIQSAYTKTAGNEAENLPKLALFVGGDIHLMFGIKYNRYMPELIFKLPSGLAIYKSCFPNVDGSYGVCGGPHPIIEEIDRQYYGGAHNFINQQYQIFMLGYQVDIDIKLLGFKDEIYEADYNNCIADQAEEDDSAPINNEHCVHCIHAIQSQMKRFHEVEDAGSEIQYRCLTCRNCKECKNHDSNEATSIKEDVEEQLIKNSIKLDVEQQIVTAKLPLLADPAVKLAPNASTALKVYKSMVKRLDKNTEDKEAVIKAELKLQNHGFVDYVTNLPEWLQIFLKESNVQNFLPWGVAYKPGSITTPARPVFNASMVTASGYALNDILAKGKNNMSKLVEIFIRFRTHMVGYHNDINTMYNQIKLEHPYWAMQRYWWNETLDPDKPPVEKVIKTLIYGCKSSANQAEHAVRSTAELYKDEFPEVHEIVCKDLYVDDCMSGESSIDPNVSANNLVSERMGDLETVLNRGGFTLKNFTVSGRPPHPSATKDGVTIGLVGKKWDPVEDIIVYDYTLNFAKKRRGKKYGTITEVPLKLTRVVCVSKVGEIFDLTGLLTPITATLKLDLHTLVIKNLKWDDILPDNLRNIWVSHFEMMNEIKDLKYNRAVIPADAASLDINTLEFGDASKDLICIAIYIRFLRQCGTYSCQLIFARSRLVPDNMTLPRAELYAALINSQAGETVKKALQKHFKSSVKFTDSQIALFWITKDIRVLKPWTRNRVIEIRRFTDISKWRYIESAEMIADLGTRRCTSLDLVSQDSVWINGFEWMSQHESSFPSMTVDEIVLSNKEKEMASKELYQVDPNINHHTEIYTASSRDLIKERYKYSNYLIDPNYRRFHTVLRIFALVLLFIRNMQRDVIRRKSGEVKNTVQLTLQDYIFVKDEYVKEAEMYYFKKATEEVRHFLKPNQYENICTEANGVLYYTGRILPNDEITIVGKATQVMRDLSSTTFCVPLTDKYSPIAHSIINEIHWYDKTVLHTGVETTWRYLCKYIFIIDGHSLVTKFKEACQRCRYLNKKALDIAMGPISITNLMIAPAFYVCQVDLAGPFKAFSYHNKRTTIKIWMVVFVCLTTSATNIKTLESYNTSSFLQAFTRFCCQVGYPKRVLTDSGSQLVKGCESACLDIQDIKFQLHKNVSVELRVCPVGGHNMHGKVERKIRHIKESLAKALSNDRLGIMQYETLGDAIANSINNLPITIGSRKANLDSLDLITPNRLLLGRNNDRSPAGTFSTEVNYDKLMAENEKIYESWFENWLVNHVPKMMDQPKWFKSDKDLKEGDIVLFLKEESEICNRYQYGIIESVEKSRDEKIRKVVVRYRNHNEKVNRTTYRSARSLVVIHSTDEVDVLQELGEIALEVDKELRRDALQ